jgi:hypothetical protein
MEYIRIERNATFNILINFFKIILDIKKISLKSILLLLLLLFFILNMATVEKILILACLKVWSGLFFKVFFTRKCIKIIIFIFKKLFLTSAHQNKLKILKKY